MLALLLGMLAAVHVAAQETEQGAPPAPPVFAELASDWWTYFEGTREEVELRADSFLETVNEEIADLGPLRQETAAATLEAVRDNFDALLTLLDEPEPADLELPEESFGYSIEDLLQVAATARDAAAAVIEERAEVSREQRVLDGATRRRDAAVKAYIDAAEGDERWLAALRLVQARSAQAISARRLEVSEASLDQAKAGVAAAEADIKRAIESKGGDSEAENTLLKIARSAVEKAQLDLDRTVVKASSGGIITDLRADVGQFAGAGQAVMTLIAVHDLWVHAEYTENNLGHLKQGTPVEILFDVLPGRVFAGRVRSIGLGVGSSQAPPPGTLPTIENQRDWLRQAQRFPVQVEFAVSQAPELARNLRIGGQASVVAYSEEAWLTALLGKLYIRVMSLLAYAY